MRRDAACCKQFIGWREQTIAWPPPDVIPTVKMHCVGRFAPDATRSPTRVTSTLDYVDFIAPRGAQASDWRDAEN